MTQVHPFTPKKMYHQPKLEVIHLDRDISLVMSSNPPLDPPPAMPGTTGYLQKIFKFRW